MEDIKILYPMLKGSNPKCKHDYEYLGTDPHGSHKGEDYYKCRKCGATGYGE